VVLQLAGSSPCWWFVNWSDHAGLAKCLSYYNAGGCNVSEGEERPSPQSAERILELTETRKSLDSFNPAPPVPVLMQMASAETGPPGGAGDSGPVAQVAQPPMDADG
jgi:hypothetical protein